MLCSDGLIGPTFSCIIGKQFKALMEGDRFFSHHTGKYILLLENFIQQNALFIFNFPGGPDIFPLKGNIFIFVLL